jgi:hypothetical protein
VGMATCPQPEGKRKLTRASAAGSLINGEQLGEQVGPFKNVQKLPEPRHSTLGSLSKDKRKLCSPKDFHKEPSQTSPPLCHALGTEDTRHIISLCLYSTPLCGQTTISLSPLLLWAGVSIPRLTLTQGLGGPKGPEDRSQKEEIMALEQAVLQPGPGGSLPCPAISLKVVGQPTSRDDPHNSQGTPKPENHSAWASFSSTVFCNHSKNFSCK